MSIYFQNLLGYDLGQTSSVANGQAWHEASLSARTQSIGGEEYCEYSVLLTDHDRIWLGPGGHTYCEAQEYGDVHISSLVHANLCDNYPLPLTVLEVGAWWPLELEEWYKGDIYDVPVSFTLSQAQCEYLKLALPYYSRFYQHSSLQTYQAVFEPLLTLTARMCQDVEPSSQVITMHRRTRHLECEGVTDWLAGALQQARYHLPPELIALVPQMAEAVVPIQAALDEAAKNVYEQASNHSDFYFTDNPY